MRNPTTGTDNSSDNDVHPTDDATHHITQDRGINEDDEDDEPAMTTHSTNEQSDDDASNDAPNVDYDDTAPDNEGDDDYDDCEDEDNDGANEEDNNTPATDNNDDGGDVDDEEINDEDFNDEATDEATNSPTDTGTGKGHQESPDDDENQEAEAAPDTGPTPPPTVAKIVQHLQDAKERNNWREALTETSLIPNIYESTAPDQLQLTPNPSTTAQVYTNWAATHEADTIAHIATGFAIMKQGTAAWMQDAFDAMIRDKHPPAQLHLTRMTAKDHFTIMHGRNKIRTSHPSAQKDLWAAFTIDAKGEEERILLAKPALFKAGKVISPIELVRDR